MKKRTFITLLLAGIFTLSAAKLFAEEMQVNPEATEEVRMAAAKEKLTQETDTVVVYAKGLCCPSCAIGVRKMISRLKFVDTKRFNKGVDLDTKAQLIMVAIDDGKTADFDSLTEAVVDAGYDPVRSYSLQGGRLQTEALTTGS